MCISNVYKPSHVWELVMKRECSNHVCRSQSMCRSQAMLRCQVMCVRETALSRVQGGVAELNNDQNMQPATRAR